jgi:hypothetical protein
MGMLLIKCPKTGMPFSTGMCLDKETFEGAALTGNTAGLCPHWRRDAQVVQERRDLRPREGADRVA